MTRPRNPSPSAVEVLLLPDLGATQALAGRLAPRLQPCDAVLLSGPLGAGKSSFARALIRALAADPELEVPSPTFTLLQTYRCAGGGLVHHLDLWRLAGPAARVELGWDEVRRDIVVVEWPERLGEAAPEGALTLDFSVAGETARRVVLGGRVGERLR